MSVFVAGTDRLAPVVAGGSPRPMPNAAPHGDPLFRLIDVGLVNLLPLAAVHGIRPFFIAVGFDEKSMAALRAAYGRHQMTGLALAHAETPAAVLDALARTTGGSSSPRFDCLSLLGGPAGQHCLDHVLAGRLRPAIIHCADRSTFDDWPATLQGLKALRFHVVGELSGATLLLDGSLLDAGGRRREIATFDVFDTLIARRSLEPWRIFDEVGIRAGLPDFVDQRRQAEARVLNGAYTFDDIYDELARHYGLTALQRRTLQDLELACEHEAVVPIAENMGKVRDGDLLVSDMYLSEGQIRGLLRKAGLTKQVGLLVESHGKSSGRVWPLITRAFEVGLHLGDNPHADVAMPARFGVPNLLTTSSSLTKVEDTLNQVGLRDLALLCREARLTTWHDDPTLRNLQLVQVSLNLPILMLASVRLARLARKLDSRRILFCSRDGNLWLPLFDAMLAKMGLAFDTRYFLTSRVARKTGSEDYLAYAQQEFGSHPIVVDLCGTGWSLAHLASRLDRRDLDVFFIDRCPPLSLFEQASRTPDCCRFHTMFEERPPVTNIPLELANAAAHGMVVDMRRTAGAFVPAMARTDVPATLQNAIDVQRAAFAHALTLMSAYGFADVLDLDDASLSLVCQALYVRMAGQSSVFAGFMASFERENEAIVRDLVCRSDADRVRRPSSRDAA